MYPHHPSKPKRPRPWLGDEEPVPSLTSPIPLVDLHYSSLSLDLQFQLQQLAHVYGLGSGLQVHHTIQQAHSRKRRRLDQYELIAQDQSPSSALIPVADYPSPVHQYDEFGQSLWFSPMHSPTSPLAKRVADLSLCLCPTCGVGSWRSDGYQQLPETPPMVYGPNRPYAIEKPPSMALPCSTSDGSTDVSLEQQSTFACDQPILDSSPLVDFPLLPDQSVLPPLPGPLITEDDQTLQNSSPIDGYPVATPMKREAHRIGSSAVSPDQVVRPGQPGVSYEPGLLDLSDPSTQQPSIVPVGDMQYSMIPAEGLSSMPVQDCWVDHSLQQPQHDHNDLLPQPRGGKRGPFRDPGLREQTAHTRRIGSCIRCRMQRIRCEQNPDEPGGPCLTCKRVANTRAGRFPCLRYKITDIKLYKPGQVPGYEWTSRWNNNISDPIQGWASGEIKVIRISEGISNRYVEFRVRKFIPQDGDKLERTWDYKGTKKSVSIPPYALVDLEEGKKQYYNHITESMLDAFKTLLGNTNSLVYRTYAKAWQMYQDPSTPMESLDILTRTLKLWMSVRFSTRSGFIVGSETLGMPPDILDQTNPNHGSIPLPPVLGAQLDLILIHHIQTRLRRELLEKLQKMVAKNKQETWLVTYLVTFILLHNTAMIIAHDEGYARKHGMKRRFAREDKVKEYHLGANILLAHFHYCNKGIYPFSEECKDQDLRTLAELDEDTIHFVHTTRAYAKYHKQEWECLQNQCAYEDEYYFVSQLFEENWQPGSMM